MGSFSSKHKFVQVATAPKPAEVLPATESWSTLDAFQNMVKENEQRKLIYRSKTREALCKTNSLRRHKTLANLPSSSKQSSKINKKPMNVCVKTQSNLSQTGITVDERDHIRPLSHIRKRSSESRLNASSRSHNSLAEDIKPDEVGNDDTVSENHPVNISHEIEVATENNIISSQESHSEPLSVANPSTTKLEGAEVVRQSIDSSTDSSTLAFRVDPEPHALFAPESQVNKRELECQSTIAQLAPLPSEELARRQVEEILHQWRNSAQLANIESHALSIPQPTTTAELADSLTNNSVSYIKSIEGKELHIQVAKAYSIYVWIANNIMYNVEQWKAFHSRDNDSLTCNTEAEEVLNTGVTVCTGYANLFKELASKCGLTVELIHGHAKTWRSLSEEKPGADTTFKPSQQNAHTWNSVVFGKVSYLVDCTYASGYVTSTMNFCKSFTRHYFAVPPQHLILTHWPSDDSWQLLKERLTLEKFQPLIPVPFSTIGLGIEPETWREVVEMLDDPVACIKFRCKENVAVFATLVTSSDSKREGFSVKSHQEGFTFISREGNHVSIRVAPPHKGKFILRIYASENSCQNYHLVLSYLIENQVEIANQVGYPIVSDEATSKFNFRPLHWNAPNRDHCCEVTGKLDVVFRAQPDLQFYHCIMPGKAADGIDPNPDQASNFNTMVIQNEAGDPSLYMLCTIFPTKGWWTLYLYANKSKVGTSSETSQNNGYELLLVYSSYVQIGIPEQSYPNILSPYIRMLQAEPILASGNEIFSICFDSFKTFDFHSYLTFENQTSKSAGNYTAIEKVAGSSHYKLNVIFPKPGRWYVHVFGRDVADPRQTLYSRMLLLQIMVDGSLENTMFPILNQNLADTLNVKYLNSGCITFHDDGSPLTFQLIVPDGSIDLIHSIKPHSTGDANFNKDLLQHCTSLSFDKHTGEPNSSPCTVCTLNAVFPWAGTWSVQVFASIAGSRRYERLIEVDLLVCNPTPNKCYIKVHPSFYHLDLSIPEQFLSYNPNSDIPELEIPFTAQENIQFVWNMEFVKSGERVFQQAIIHQSENVIQNSSAGDNIILNRILHVIFPKPGEWTFHLHGRTGNDELQEEKHNYESVLEIRINVSSFNDKLGFPHVFHPFRSVFGMKLDKDNLPLISNINSIPSTVSVPFYCPPNVKLWYDIEGTGNGTSDTEPSAQLKSGSRGLHELVFEINKKGKWTITLYAQLLDSHKKNWTAVLKHTVSSE